MPSTLLEACIRMRRPSECPVRIPKLSVLLTLCAACGLPCLPMPGLAAEPEARQPAAEPSCIEVEVDGERAPSYACLSERLRPTAGARAPQDPGIASEAVLQRPGNQLGVFNRAATANRMGNTFGTSVYPQRPPVMVPTLPFGPRAP